MGQAGTPYNRSLGLEWHDNQQHLNQGYIQSRVTAQFLVTSSRKTERRLTIAASTNPSTQANDSLSITNQLGCHIRQLLVCDENGTLYSGEEITPDSKKQLTATTWGSIGQTWNQEYRDNEPGQRANHYGVPFLTRSDVKNLMLAKDGILEKRILSSL